MSKRVTVITGASGVLGRAIADAALARGDAVAAIDARPPFAVAVNTTFVPNTGYAARTLQPGDRVEIISPVTGG